MRFIPLCRVTSGGQILKSSRAGEQGCQNIDRPGFPNVVNPGFPGKYPQNVEKLGNTWIILDKKYKILLSFSSPEPKAHR